MNTVGFFKLAVNWKVGKFSEHCNVVKVRTHILALGAHLQMSNSSYETERKQLQVCVTGLQCEVVLIDRTVL